MKAELIDVMGDDLRVVNAARVSFDKESFWEEIYSRSLDAYNEIIVYKELSEKDAKLINYLAKHGHWTPFSHVTITMRETVPIFVARQRFKHKIGFTENEVSRRYVDDTPEFYIPDAWRKAAKNKKQGSSEEILQIVPFGQETLSLIDVYEDLIDHASDVYDMMIKAGVCPEQARMVLPQSMYTSYYVTGSLAAWARAYKLRTDPHAQKEIQDLAVQWNDIIGNIKELEHSWKALTT